MNSKLLSLLFLGAVAAAVACHSRRPAGDMTQSVSDGHAKRLAAEIPGLVSLPPAIGEHQTLPPVQMSLASWRPRATVPVATDPGDAAALMSLADPLTQQSFPPKDLSLRDEPPSR